MNLLALETSTEYLSLALQKDDQLFHFHANSGAVASQNILSEINRLLHQAEMHLQQLDGIAVGIGPGAFTGVRVACGVAQGLAFGAHLHVVGVNTLEAVAEHSGASEALVCMDARMGEVYFAAYKQEKNQWVEVNSPVVCKPESIPVLGGGAWTGVGNGWAVYHDILENRYRGHLSTINPAVYPNATAILRLAQPRFSSGKAISPSALVPLYVRNRVALTTEERELGMRL